jgi:hypothetical protein
MKTAGLPENCRKKFFTFEILDWWGKPDHMSRIYFRPHKYRAVLHMGGNRVCSGLTPAAVAEIFAESPSRGQAFR